MLRLLELAVVVPVVVASTACGPAAEGRGSRASLLAGLAFPRPASLSAERSPMADERARAAHDLHVLSARLDELAPFEEAIAAPWQWAPEHADRLACDVEELEPWLAGVREVVSRDACRDAVRRREAIRSTDVSLGRLRNAINVLCARAVLDARGGDPTEAFRRLDDARSVTALSCDRTLVGEMLHRACDAIVLEAVATIAAER